jgi:hypothetical protein
MSTSIGEDRYMTRITTELADAYAARARKVGVSHLDEDELLNDLLDTWTGGELDFTQSGILQDMVRERLARPAPNLPKP